ncbi:MAG: methionine--tRNA ligase [Verrucomicrobia bacterium]|jgi:methionyl-tRNA synthetase|nr:methionine--tRNA ligase [Verrucomicrobiota bacterium]
MNKRFYITTAIDYVNGAPHLGHAYEKVIADVIARGQRALGHEAFFLTGLDEHGQKVQQAAQAEGKPTQAYVDELAAVWKTFAHTLQLSNNDFIRTTEPRHKQVVAALLTKLHAQGDIYKAEYRGWYSWRQETFLTHKDRNPDGSWDPIYGEVRELVEENWYFKMGQYQQWLLEHIEANPDFVYPDYRRNEVLGFLKKEPLADLCISRPRERLNWGIPMPFDPDYVNYVWFDALTNYITVPASQGDPAILAALPDLQSQISNPTSQISLWPADIHVIGKDILKFHAVYWPIMLHAGGLPLPRQIVVHGWWQKEGAKISKTTGNIVDPIAVINEWGLDAFRFYVLRELDIGPDGNWTDSGFAARYTAELANGLGNLVNRSLSMLHRYRQGVVPERSTELAGDAATAVDRVRRQLATCELQAAVQSVWTLVARANQYVDHTAPFKLAKDPAQAGRLDAVLYNLVETCRILAVLLWPFLPTTAGRIYEQLGCTGVPDQLALADWGGAQPGHTLGKPEPLFPRKEPSRP